MRARQWALGGWKQGQNCELADLGMPHAQMGKWLLNERLRRRPLTKLHRQSSLAEEATGSMAWSSTAQALLSATHLQHNRASDRPITMAWCRLPAQPVEMSPMGQVHCDTDWGLWQQPQLPTGPSPEAAPHNNLQANPGASSSCAVPDSVTGFLDSAPLRTTGGEAQRAAGGPHRRLFPFPRPSRPLEELCCRRHRHQPWPPHQHPGLPARDCFALLSAETPKLPLPISSSGRTMLRGVTALSHAQK